MASQFSFEAIGTHWHIDIQDSLDAAQEENLLTLIMARIELFDKAYSRFRADSLVTEMSQKSGEFVLPDDAEPMMNMYSELYVITEGHMTPLIGQVLVDAGYDPQYSLQQKKELEQPAAWHEVIEYDHPRIMLKQPALLDFGAAGKGYLIDLVADVIKSHGVSNFYIDAGGDIVHQDIENKPIRVGLENPNDFSQVIGVVEFANKSLCGSAGSRRKWQDFHHIIDPFSLSSPQEIIATWVIADTTLLADGLASALFFVPSEKLTKRFNFEYVVLFADYSIDRSDNFPGELFTE